MLEIEQSKQMRTQLELMDREKGSLRQQVEKLQNELHRRDRQSIYSNEERGNNSFGVGLGDINARVSLEVHDRTKHLLRELERQAETIKKMTSENDSLRLQAVASGLSQHG